MDSPDISVIIGSQNSRLTIQDCLRALTTQSNRIAAEIIVVDASQDGTAELVRTEYPNVTLLRSEPHRLIPTLWGLGIEHARAPIIALTIAQCIPADDWLANIVQAMENHTQAAGIGGPLDGPHNGTAMDWAVYFSRYSAFMPPAKDGPIREIAADNAAYRRSALESWWIERDNGFWETLFHHQLRSQGASLYYVSNMCVRLSTTPSAGQFAAARFQHGRHFASTRPGTTFLMRVARTLGAPILLPILLTRIYQRVTRHRPDWKGTFWSCLPWLTLFLLAWSLGEAIGYLLPQPRTR